MRWIRLLALAAWYFTYWDYYGAVSIVGPFPTFDVCERAAYPIAAYHKGSVMIRTTCYESDVQPMVSPKVVRP